MEIAITKMSTKGQIVIPSEMRNNFDVGEKLLVIKSDNQLIIKKASKLDKQLKEDIEFSKRVGEAWKRYDNGEFIKMSADDFLKELDKW